MADADDVVVRGRVVFPEGDWSGTTARLVVRVEDARRADAPARTVAQQVTDAVRLPGGGTRSVPFEMRVAAGLVGPGSPYSVRVHVDTTASGAVTTGDFVSTRRYPLDRSELEIHVRRV
jgi:uncharacterized lipoprotein YbaY